MAKTRQDVAVDVFGTMGAIFWSIQLIPQLYLNYRKKDTTGLQPSMMLLWAFAGLPLGIHNILAQENVALQVQAQILTLLSLLTWSQVMFYGHNWSLRKSTFVVLLLALAFGAVEAGIVCGIKYGTNQHVPTWTLTLFASLAATGLGLGVLRHYYDIYKHRSVRGISFFFVALDATGDLTSLISVSLDGPVSSAALAIYAVELALWMGIMIAGLVYNFRAWRRGDDGEPPVIDTSSPASNEVNVSVQGQSIGLGTSDRERDSGDASSASSVFHTPASGQTSRISHRVTATVRLRHLA